MVPDIHWNLQPEPSNYWKFINGDTGAIHLHRTLLYMLMNSILLNDISSLLDCTAPPYCKSKTLAAFKSSVFSLQMVEADLRFKKQICFLWKLSLNNFVKQWSILEWLQTNVAVCKMQMDFHKNFIRLGWSI